MSILSASIVDYKSTTAICAVFDEYIYATKTAAMWATVKGEPTHNNKIQESTASSMAHYNNCFYKKYESSFIVRKKCKRFFFKYLFVLIHVQPPPPSGKKKPRGFARLSLPYLMWLL